MMKRAIARIALCIVAALTASSALAQGYPTKPVRVVVPYPAGGVVDLVARAVTDKVVQNWGQPIIVENKPGANGNIGADYVRGQPADGYMLMMGSPFIAVSPSLDPETRFKTADFVGVALVGAPPNLFVVPTALPVNTMQEFIAYARARPGKLNTPNPGTGSSNHLGMEMFFNLTGLDIVSIPYKGQPPSIPDLLNAQLSFALLTNALAIPHIKTGKLKALAISAPARSKQLPDVPTVVEAGLPAEAIVLPWYGFVAAAGTPKDAIARFNAEVNKALQSPEVVERLDKLGTLLMGGPSEEFDKLIKTEEVRWSKLVKDRKLKAE